MELKINKEMDTEMEMEVEDYHNIKSHAHHRLITF